MYDRRSRPSHPREREFLVPAQSCPQSFGFFHGTTGHSPADFSDRDYMQGWLDGNLTRIAPPIDAAHNYGANE